jgi:hypothetical protein
MIISKRTVLLGCASLLVGLTSGCAMEQKKVAQGLENPGRVDCRTAEGDIRVLKSEKAHVAQRLVEGVTAIYPAGAVLGIVTGTERTKLSVATGDYNNMIDQRIAEIQRTCGL